MYKYKCDNCGCEFEEPEEERTTYESYYGVSSLFRDRHSLTLYVCPNCKSEDIDEIEEEEEEYEDEC